MTFVIKSDGRKEEYTVDKIKACIDFACTGLDVNPLILESKFDSIIYDGITTDEIQNNLVEGAKSLCNPKNTDWSYVAGRLLTMRYWKTTSVFDKSFQYYMKEQMDNGTYAHPMLKKWTKKEIKELSGYICHDRDFNYSYGSVITGRKKYLMNNEYFQYMFMANAMIIGALEPRSTRLDFVKELYDALSLREISLASPWNTNLRGNGNIASCFILSVNDDMESLANSWKNVARISKEGGGIGYDISRIRASGAPINGRPNSSKGVIPWIKILNDISVAVDQGGKRPGAVTIALPVWHRDIEEFLEIQSENKDVRRQCFDIFPQVGIHDIFMEEVEKEDGGVWYTFCPYEVKTVLGLELYGCSNEVFNSRYRKSVEAYKDGILLNVEVYNAKSLMKQKMKTAFETGLPYLGFIDTINRDNPNSHDGHIPCVNLCTESFSNVVPDELTHVCNLASIVAGRVRDDEHLERLTRLLVRVLDNGIELSRMPTKEADKHSSAYRTIGIGIQGMHDYLAKEGSHYGDLKTISEFCEKLQYSAVKASIELAEERGAYGRYEGSKWDDGTMINKYIKNSTAGLDWASLGRGLKKHGIRNSQLTSPAPNSSTAPFMDASAGFLPVYRAYFLEDNSSGIFPVFGMHIKDNPLAYERTLPRATQSEITKSVGAGQVWIDTGISAEYVFDLNKPNANAKDLYDLWVAAWKNKNKATYYIRSIKKGSTIDDLLGGDSACVGCDG